MNNSQFYFDEEKNTFFIQKDEISFEEFVKKIIPIKGEFKFEKINNVFVKISKNSKYVKFIKNGEEEKNIFVVNIHQVYFLIEKFKFNHYKIDGKLASEINIDDNLDFNVIEYIPNLLFKDDYYKAKEDISTKNKILLDDLSLMYYDYQKFKDQDDFFILSEERNEFFKELTYLRKKKKFIPICGPKSIGKTTSLLYYLKMNAMWQYFYINLSYCKKLLNDGKKEILCLCICKELFNCLMFEDVIAFYDTLSEINYNNIMDLVLFVIKYLKEKYIFDNIYILLDQYKEKIDKDYKIIQEIESIANVYSRFTIFICSSINEFDLRNSLKRKLQKSNKFYLNYLFINKLIYINTNIIKDRFNNDEINLLNESGNLFLYYNMIDDNKNIKGNSPLETKKEIMDHIKKEITEYFNEKDPIKKLNIIKLISDNINIKIKFIDLKENLGIFPFKFFNIYINDQNMFILDELKDYTELIIRPNCLIVIECLNEIFHECKKTVKKYSLDTKNINTYKSKISVKLEDNFNDYLWLYRYNFSFYGCKIKNKIHINSLLDLNDSDAIIIKKAANQLENVSDSILIIQDDQNAKHYDTSILKLFRIEKEQKFFELYLTQETLKKEAKERLFNLRLVEDKICLKFRIFLKSSVKIENIYFSYVFDKNNLDNTTINYCKDIKINFHIYDDESPNLINSEIESKITSKFEYPKPSKKNQNEKYLYTLNNLDIDFSKEEIILNNEYNKLNNFLNKKRKFIKEIPKELSIKIKEIEKYVNNEFRKYEIKENIIHEYLMEKEDEKIIGITFIVDDETKEILNTLNFENNELKNLYNLMGKYNKNVNILKIIKLSNKNMLDSPNYDCCILQINSKKDKYYFDLQSKYLISLKDLSKIKIKKINLEDDFYLIKFTIKNMIYNV